jgi:hypothetical protein
MNTNLLKSKEKNIRYKLILITTLVVQNKSSFFSKLQKQCNYFKYIKQQLFTKVFKYARLEGLGLEMLN